jgi:hypothetical protein
MAPPLGDLGVLEVPPPAFLDAMLRFPNNLS